jgi:hypothetical protein
MTERLPPPPRILNSLEELSSDLMWLCVAKKVSGRDAVRALASALGSQIANNCDCKQHDHLAEMRSIVDDIIRQYVPNWRG